jgi:hypothetical protein
MERLERWKDVKGNGQSSYVRNYLEGLTEMTISLSRDSQSPGRDLNLGPHEEKLRRTADHTAGTRDLTSACTNVVRVLVPIVFTPSTQIVNTLVSPLVDKSSIPPRSSHSEWDSCPYDTPPVRVPRGRNQAWVCAPTGAPRSTSLTSCEKCLASKWPDDAQVGSR